MNSQDSHSSSQPEEIQTPSLVPVDAAYEHTEQHKKTNKQTGWWGGLLAMGAILLGKLKFLAVLFKFAWLSKYLVTAGTMLLTIGAYALVEPWPFAVGFVLLIFVHEMGHLLVLRQYGLKATAPVFIPYIGAMIAMKDMPHNARIEALTAFGGPALGGLGALVCFIVWNYSGWTLLLHLAYIGFFLNLFNLMPISPLDGGRILNAVSKWFMLIGLAMLLGFMFTGHVHPVMILILIAGVAQTFKRFTNKEPVDPTYYEIGAMTKFWLGAGYIALAITLAFLSLHSYQLIQAGN